MSSRREFVALGAFAMGALAAGRELAATAVTAPQPQALAASGPLHAIVYDDRIPESSAFAAHVQARGERTLTLDRGDVTRLWYDDFYHRWKQGPAGIAGLTTPGALFVLQTLGNDAGLRLQFKAEHRLQGGQVEHRLYGPDRMLRAALPLESSGDRWSTHMGQVICGCRPRGFGRSEARLTTHVPAASLSERNFLVSWVLAPRPPRSLST